MPYTQFKARTLEKDFNVKFKAAQLIAAQLLNKEDDPDFNKTIYGCSTTGIEWRFLTLKDNVITIDLDRYYIHQIKQLLGVLQEIVDEAWKN